MVSIVVNGKHIEYDEIVRHKRQGEMVTDEQWKARVRGLLKAALAQRGIGYKELARRLEGIGVKETEQNIANKMSRGGFSAVFFVQCLDAIEADRVVLK
jgi:hypothetical protein